MKSLAPCLLVCVLASSCTSGSQNTGTTSASAATSPPSPKQDPPIQGQNLGRCKWKIDGDEILLVSAQDRYAVSLPGHDWRVACDDEQMLVADSPRGIYASIKPHDPKARVVIPEYLMGIATNVGDNMRQRGFVVAEPQPRELQAAHQTSPAVFLAVDISPLEPNAVQLNYWTARQRADGIVLDFHISAVVPRNTSKKATGDALAAMERATSLFSVLEEIE